MPCRIFNISSQWQDPEILVFCYKRILRRIRSHAETPCVQVSARSICQFNKYRQKIGPREAEADSRRFTEINGVSDARGQVRNCASPFLISGTARRISLKFSVCLWANSHAFYIGISSGAHCTCARSRTTFSSQ